MNASAIRTLTKIGMVGTLALLVMPHFHQRGHRNCCNQDPGPNLHVLAGVALVGFSVWHYNCYKPPAWMLE